jgi:hypothetical protein
VDDNSERKANLVCHYTVAEGLKGIIENRCIWATNVSFLNDFSEYQHGVEVVREVIEKLDFESEDLIKLGIEPTGLNRYIARVVLTGFVMSQLEMRDHSPSTFVASFFDSDGESSGAIASDAGDVLEQWRGYSRDAPGFSIGFNKVLLKTRVSVDGRLTPGLAAMAEGCLYEADEKAALAAQILESLRSILPTFLRDGITTFGKAFLSVPFAARAQKGDLREDAIREGLKRLESLDKYDNFAQTLTRMFPDFLSKLMFFPAFMKHRAFRAEREWRILAFVTNPKVIRLRTTRSGFIPYVEVPISDPSVPSDLRPGIIKRIVIGPLGLVSDGQKENQIAAVKALLRKNGIPENGPDNPEGVVVESSRIPLRKC